MPKKRIFFRGVRKSANVTRKIASKAETFSGRVEKKADRIIHGTDPTLQIHEKVLQEKIFAEALPEIVPIHPALPTPGRKASVNLLIPSLQNSSFFGGTATAILFSAHLAQTKKMPLRIVETLKHGKAKTKELRTFLLKAGYDVRLDDLSQLDLAGRKYNHYGYLDIHPDDIHVASAWWDAHLLDKLPLPKKFIYLIQDFEPIFYNNSDKYILAEETYVRDTYIPVFNTELMYKFMKKRGYAGIPSENAYFFEPAINIGKQVGYARTEKNSKCKLFVYGRPSVHRNLFHRAVEAIDHAFSSRVLDPDKWEVYMAGQDKLPNILLDCGVAINNLGKMSFAQYYEFAKTVDVGLSLMMAPHPSYPPLELSSLGAAVVTTKYETKNNLSNYCENIITVESDVKSLVEGLNKAAQIPLEKRVGNAKNSSLSDSWQDSFKNIVRELAKSV